jgi:predicted phage baseplate assembly protein
VLNAQPESQSAYGLTGPSTVVTLDDIWLYDEDLYLDVFRKARAFAQEEPLVLADETIEDALCDTDVPSNTQGVQAIELDGLYPGLESGRWVIVSGERTDIPGVTGVEASELAMIAAVDERVQQVEDGVDRPGDTLHTVISLAEPLAYCYKRDTVTIYGNVVKATHGETRTEVLGSGDGTQARQRFALKQKPLTHVAAATAQGTDTTLEVRVDDVRWREADNLFELGSNDRYITRMDDEQNTTVIFGDGLNGARLPSGVENVKAIYRSGIGRPGNVAAEQISLLATRPLGVKGVINPMAATGGADREGRDQARSNTPVALLALDRLVSVQDYADFARTFAGIGKAYAARLSNGHQQVVYLTIAGADDIPIDKTSDLYRNLRLALSKCGDPFQPVEIDLRELVLLIMKARVRVLPDYDWEKVAPKVRAALLHAFSFQRRELGQDVLASEVISVIQQVPGVDYVDLDLLEGVSESDAEDPGQLATKLQDLINAPRCAATTAGRNEKCQPRQRIELHLATFDRAGRRFRPAQLALLSDHLSETLILEVIP